MYTDCYAAGRPSVHRSASLGALSFITPPVTPLSIHARTRALLRAPANPTTPFAGRDDERAVIDSFIQYDQEKTVLYISGAPGTGKTALVDDVLRAQTTDVKIVRVNCVGLAAAGPDALWQRISEEIGDEPSPRKKLRGKSRAVISSASYVSLEQLPVLKLTMCIELSF